MRTLDEAIKWLNNSVGKQYDFDGAYGYQCYDYANAYFNYTTGLRLSGMYAKNIHTDNASVLNNIATVHENTPNFLPLPGDIVIFNGRYGGGCGHVAIVTQATLNSFEVIEQNWQGGGYVNGRPGWETATRRWHQYDNPMWFIRLNYAGKKSIKNVLPSKQPNPKKLKIALVPGHGYADPGATGNGTNERDFIRKNIVPNVAKYLRTAGHDVYLYGGSNMSQDMYQDTAYGQRLGNKKDYGLYWLKHNQNPDVVVEFHLDWSGGGASGGHVIISNKFNADTIDNGIQSVIKSNLGQIRGVTPRNDLLNVNVSAELNVNYRLAELGFITNKSDMDYIKRNIDKYCREIAGAIHGKPIGGTLAGKTQVNRISWGLSGTFYPDRAIKVRRQAGLNGEVVDQASWLYSKDDWVKFDQVIKKDGYWWIRFKYQAPGASKAYFYCAVCKITDKEEKIKNEKYWGNIKWL
ncbi:MULTISPECIES: N-acetylmuramoyl-L-alanine amidase [Staphylococcus]|uniref:N-acetylmuramoyl-L-alanine amidase n=1 Tax=Staphylococcus agnetis TaxID=985762 RepID=A0AAW9YYJ1_9STAP|nr:MULTISPECIES: N-acetylmuramoyl-L-alanine amidase [Staphylococcus]NHM93511.1 CHAP domain-containing protein [Staphylococcus sp. 10602379]NJI03579.1 CHAP domain-containing protein [Staphylococcus agnetis]NJI14326.1 CHAP domain-containing protein [Staphylococcus agnetis]QIN24493.1 CHAP domain-containing protein [Staphylococcus agnetis]